MIYTHNCTKAQSGKTWPERKPKAEPTADTTLQAKNYEHAPNDHP